MTAEKTTAVVTVAQAQPAVVTMQPAVGGAPPPGAPADGVWIEERYCGPISCLVAIFVCPFVCCCPCLWCCPCVCCSHWDTRNVYQVNGKKYNAFGAIVANETTCEIVGEPTYGSMTEDINSCN